MNLCLLLLSLSLLLFSIFLYISFSMPTTVILSSEGLRFISIILYFFLSLISISIFIDLLLILVFAFSYSWWVIFCSFSPNISFSPTISFSFPTSYSFPNFFSLSPPHLFLNSFYYSSTKTLHSRILFLYLCVILHPLLSRLLIMFWLSISPIRYTGCSWNIVFFEDFEIFRILAFPVFPRCQCVYTHKAGRTPGLQQNWQSSE